jgi:hypothetical protein
MYFSTFLNGFYNCIEEPLKFFLDPNSLKEKQEEEEEEEEERQVLLNERIQKSFDYALKPPQQKMPGEKKTTCSLKKKLHAEVGDKQPLRIEEGFKASIPSDSFDGTELFSPFRVTSSETSEIDPDWILPDWILIDSAGEEKAY